MNPGVIRLAVDIFKFFATIGVLILQGLKLYDYKRNYRIGYYTMDSNGYSPRVAYS